jgi:hypothetical protein
MAINFEARKWWTNPSAALRYIVAVVAVALEVVLAKEIENWRAHPLYSAVSLRNRILGLHW